MTVQLGAFLRTTLPLGLDALADYDSGRYHSIWLPDHMVSFWPDSIWTPEFTDLAIASPSPHRHLDALAVAGAVAVLTKNTPMSTLVVDTARRHPVMLAQTALTLSHLSKGRFILGLGSGELENVGPYGFEFSKPVSKLEESLKVIKLLWESDGPVDFEGQFFKLQHARLDTEAYEGKLPPIYLAAGGPRALRLVGQYADGWFPGATRSPEHYAQQIAAIKQSAEQHGRDPEAITPIYLRPCFIGDDDELEELFAAPLVKSFMLQIDAEMLRTVGFEHPMGPNWQGIHDLDPSKLTRDVLLDMFERTTSEMLRAWVPHGPPEKVALHYKQYVDAGAKVVKMLDYGGMAGTRFAARSVQRTREAEDVLLRICNGWDSAVMLTVHHLRNSVSERVVWLVEELGIPCEIKSYDREADMAAPPEYKALYGFGTAPVITGGDLTLGESSAVVEYICREYADGRLMRDRGDKDWVDFLFWFHFANGSLIPALTIEHFTGKVVGKHPARTDRAADLMEARLAQAPFFAGEEFTAADVMMALMRFAKRHDLSDKPHTLDYLARITARPAWQRAAAFG